MNGEIVKKAIKISGKTQNEVAEQLGISYEHLSRMLKGTISDTYAERIRKLGINFESVPQSNRLIPYYNGDVLAGKVDIVKDPESEYVKDYYSIPNMKADAIIDVTGDSMYPTYKRGDRVILKAISDLELIEVGAAYMIVTIDNNRVLKRIFKADKKEYWLLKSDNEEFPPYEIPISKVLKVYLVKGCMRTE